jgi:Zn-dependent protease
MGSIVVPFLAVMFTNYSFGWAKPVPYNPLNLRGKFAETWVASAGVLTNFLIALLAFLAFKGLVFFGVSTAALGSIIFLIIWINVSLGLFNLLPVPPFDGMSIAQSLFPRLRFMNLSFAYNPIYMIGIIILASSFFGMIAPHLFGFLQGILY